MVWVIWLIYFSFSHPVSLRNQRHHLPKEKAEVLKARNFDSWGQWSEYSLVRSTEKEFQGASKSNQNQGKVHERFISQNKLPLDLKIHISFLQTIQDIHKKGIL